MTKLVTCEYLQRFGVHVDHTYCLCGHDDESLDHLFFGCIVARKICMGVSEGYKIQRRPRPWSGDSLVWFT